MTEQQDTPVQEQIPSQSADTHPYPYTTNSMDGVPYTPAMFTPRKGTTEDAQREREISGMYDLFTDVMKKPVILDWIVFQKFIPLFNKKVLDSINIADKSQTDPVRDLSEEFLKLVNPYKEYHVRMPDGTLNTFPPIYTPVTRLNDNVLKALDIYDNILTKCVDQPWKREEATALMIGAMYESQNPQIVELQQQKYRKYAEEMHMKLYNQRLEENTTAEDLERKVSTTEAPEEESHAEVTLGMEYVLD